MSSFPGEGSPTSAFRPATRFWVLMGAAYGMALALGLVFPMLGRLTERVNFLMNMLGYSLSGLAMIGASLVLALMICRVKLPYVWWVERVRGEEVSELDGVFFQGGSVERLSEEARRRVFRAEEPLQRWDIVFGVLMVLLISVHGAAAYGSHQVFKLWY